MSASIWPGFHLHCDCYLKKVGPDIPISSLDIFGQSLNLYLEDWTANLPGFLSLLGWSKTFQPFPLQSINEIEQAHIRYGTNLSIGEVLKKMRDEFVGFFKRSSIWDDFFQWRVLKTIQHYECIDGTYCGTTPPGFKGLWPAPRPYKPLTMPWTVTGSTFSRRNIYSPLNNQLKPDDLKPYTPMQTYKWGGFRI
ncbi:MAG: hypothetical protein MUO76_23915 [Anaerolineaceae bacterium]|nr:hypothetical protein [Anaerolineaceae bacterium]